METQYFKEYSPALGRDMECKVYGHAGRPMIYIPCQNGRFYDFENFHMAGTWGPWIESGKLMVLSVDTMDQETWSDTNGDPRRRIERHEAWNQYVVGEAAQKIRYMAMERNGWDELPGVMVFGSSLGATHAVNFYFRWPDVFDRLLALSGIYTAEYGFGAYMDDLVYLNSPVHYLANMPTDHPYIAKYNKHKAVICVGQGPWEMPDSTRQLHGILDWKEIYAWVDYWGYDCAHDWDWWYKQVVYFAPYLLDMG